MSSLVCASEVRVKRCGKSAPAPWEHWGAVNSIRSNTVCGTTGWPGRPQEVAGTQEQRSDFKEALYRGNPGLGSGVGCPWNSGTDPRRPAASGGAFDGVGAGAGAAPCQRTGEGVQILNRSGKRLISGLVTHYTDRAVVVQSIGRDGVAGSVRSIYKSRIGCLFCGTESEQKRMRRYWEVQHVGRV